MKICDLESRISFSMTDKINQLSHELNQSKHNYEQLLAKYQKQSSVIKYNYPSNTSRIILQQQPTNNNRVWRENMTERQNGNERNHHRREGLENWGNHSGERDHSNDEQVGGSYGQMMRASRKNANIREQNFSFFSQSPINNRSNNENDQNLMNRKKPPKPNITEDHAEIIATDDVKKLEFLKTYSKTFFFYFKLG
jgi:hypothetical protein